MKIFHRFVLVGVCFCVSSLTAQAAFSQQLKGQYAPSPPVAEEEALNPVIPRVFSSQVVDSKQAEKLDVDFYNLGVVLFGYYDVDMTYKQRLYELIEPFKFEVTRRGREFKKDLSTSKDAVNNNYKKMMDVIKKHEVDFKASLANFTAADKAILEKVYEEESGNFTAKVDKYFEMQAKFLKTYQKLVNFILARNGSYYYSEASKSLSFYDAGQYKLYGNLVDALNKINFDQVQMIKEMRSGVRP